MTEGKPKPMIFQRAAESFGSVPEPSACLVFEDAPTGVAAGKAADMCVRCVTPTCSGLMLSWLVRTYLLQIP